MAVEHPRKKNIFKEVNSCKNSGLGPAKQHTRIFPTNIFQKTEQQVKGIHSAEKKRIRIFLIGRVIIMAASEKSNIVADSKISKIR